MGRSCLKRIISGSLKTNYLLITVIGFNMLVMCTSGDTILKYGLKMYVSNAGNDSWSGKIKQPGPDKTDGPFATIEGARNAIRELKKTKKLPKGNIIVEIQSGVYELPGTFELETIDGGSDSSSRIIFLGQEDGEVKLIGGKELTKWVLVTDKDILEKFRPGTHDKIFQTDLAAIGIKDFGSPGGNGIELFYDNKAMFISRYPNKGFVNIAGVLRNEPIRWRSTNKVGDKVGKFIYSDRRIDTWEKESDAWVHGWWFHDWSEQRQKISKINTKKRIIEVVPPYHAYGYRQGQWFYGFNLLSEIDEPGEYYIDRTNGILYFYPPSDIEKGHAFLSLNKNIISLNKVSFLTIKGLTLEGCRENVITMLDCNNVLIAGCTMRNAGNWAVAVNGGMHNGVASCDIYEVGAGGIRIDAGDRKTLIAAECFADNNYIHHTARIKRLMNPCISLNGVGNRATHNLLEHVPHMAVFFSGNDHLIEYNEINDACYESNDAGAIYAGRNWTMRGNIIRYNYLHDIDGFEGKGCVGIYLDDTFSSADIIGNVFKNVTRATMIGGGRDNKILNNIFVDCFPSIFVDARGIGWMEKLYIPDWLQEAEKNGTISGIAFKKAPYSTKYPELENILNGEPGAPEGNVISRNICVSGNWDKYPGYSGERAIQEKARPYLTMEDNVVAPGSGVVDSLSNSIVYTDPLFLNQKNPGLEKYRLSANSPALKLGFKPIPFDKIGLYKSKDRLRMHFSN